MQDLKEKCRLALVQASPVMFEKTASLNKALEWIDKAAKQGAELVVFPELFLPGYPFGMTFGFKVGSRDEEGRKDWKLYYDNSVVCPGPRRRRLAQRQRSTISTSASVCPSAMIRRGHFTTRISCLRPMGCLPLCTVNLSRPVRSGLFGATRIVDISQRWRARGGHSAVLSAGKTICRSPVRRSISAA